MVITTWTPDLSRYCWAYADDMMFSEPFHGFVLKTVDYKSSDPDTEQRFDELEPFMAAMAALNERWQTPNSVGLFTKRQVDMYLATKDRLWFGEVPQYVRDHTGLLPADQLKEPVQPDQLELF